MARIEEIAGQLSYQELAIRYAVASESKSDATAEIALLKDVLNYKLSHETEGVDRSSKLHEASGEQLSTLVFNIGPYKAQVKEGITAGFDSNALIERLQAMIAETTAQGDRQVSRRELLREVVQLVNSCKTYTKKETTEITA
jgi:hypothetical protein